MIEVRLYSRIRNKNYLYYILFICLEDQLYYNITDKPVFLKKKISKWGFKYIKESLHLSLTTREEHEILENITGKDSKWVKIIDIKY